MKEPMVKMSRRGKRYNCNPFIVQAVANTKSGVKRIVDKSGSRMMVVAEETGEVIAPAGFWQTQEVDKTQFVKLYVNGVKAFRDLTGAGTKVFELLYLRVQENTGKDQIWMTFPDVSQTNPSIRETTFYRGVKELLEKEFIAESMTPGLYYLNPDYLWNGDRLAFVKEYIKRQPTPKNTTDQLEMEI